MKLTKKRLIPLLCAAAMLVCAGICEGIAAVGTGGKLHQQAAERWASDGELPYVQVSAFFSESSAPSTSTVESLQESVNKALTTASLEAPDKNARLWYDAWSAEQGTVVAKGTKMQESKAIATAIGGDFFRIHPMKLLSGGYVQPDDVMQDRVVIDTLLAWQTFGSSNVAGMELTVDGTIYQIAGVVEPEQDKRSQKAYGEMPRIYMPFVRQEDSESSFVCYETVLPNPVRGFAEKTLKEALGERDDMKLLVNTGRGTLTRRWENLRHLREMVIAGDGIAYPWWENAARMRAYSMAELLRLEILLMIFPVLYCLTLIWKGYRLAERFIIRKREQFKRRYRTIEKDPYSV